MARKVTKSTYTHKDQGGRFALVGQHHGQGALEGQQLVIYHDLGKDVTAAVTADEWRQQWRPIARDDCQVCMGTGYDHIKGNKANPCGGCYGLGKVREAGETPANLWELAEVATRIITGLRSELGVAVRQLKAIHAAPGVNEALEAHLQQAISDSTARQEQEWRDGRGHGPGGRRHTGD